MASTTQQPQVHEKIKELESKYNEHITKLSKNTVQLHNDESALLTCLQKMLPVKRASQSDKLTELEEKRIELEHNLTQTQLVIQTDEHNLLGCLQQLMPLQNSYLLGVIETLQTQLKELNQLNADKMTTPVVAHETPALPELESVPVTDAAPRTATRRDSNVSHVPE